MEINIRHRASSSRERRLVDNVTPGTSERTRTSMAVVAETKLCRITTEQKHAVKGSLVQCRTHGNRLMRSIVAYFIPTQFTLGLIEFRRGKISVWRDVIFPLVGGEQTNIYT